MFRNKISLPRNSVEIHCLMNRFLHMQLEKHILLLVWFPQLFKILSSGFLIKDRKLYISSNELHTWVRRKININYILFHSCKIKISVLFINDSKAIQISRAHHNVKVLVECLFELRYVRCNE